MTVDRIALISTARRHAREGTGRTIRTAAGLSLADIGNAVGVNESTILRWERGEFLPRGDRAVKWARLLAKLDSLNSSTAA